MIFCATNKEHTCVTYRHFSRLNEWNLLLQTGLICISCHFVLSTPCGKQKEINLGIYI